MVENARSYFMIGYIALKSKEGPCFLLDPREMDGGPYLQVSLRGSKGCSLGKWRGKKKKVQIIKKKLGIYNFFSFIINISSS